jgi:PTH1 family peptidyl-tRNA hydrolase
MKYIIGLGNPTKEYKNTRHNIGQDLVFALEKTLDDKVLALTEAKLITLPGYINESGLAMKKLFKNIKPDSENKNILIIHDDLDQVIGKMKMVYGGNSGGHNGINSILSHMKTKNYYKLKIGISPEIKKSKDEVHGYVLGKFSKDENEIIKSLMPKIVEAVILFIGGNEEKAVETVNRVIK